MLSPQAALIYAMVAAACSEREGATARIGIIADLVEPLPIFGDIDQQQVSRVAARCVADLARPLGVDRVYGQIRDALTARWREAAYALSCDVVALCRPQQDGRALERIRAQLEVDAATAQTIERAARARSAGCDETAPAQRQASTSAALSVPSPS
jgi:hypothetical protein